MFVQEQNKVIYLDYNATTPYAETVKNVMLETVEHFWGNPSSTYKTGIKAKQVIEKSRSEVASMIGARASEIVFVSGGTEANNVAIKSAIEGYKMDSTKTPHVVSTEIEHDATLKFLKQLMGKNEISVSFLTTNSDGSVDPESVKSEIKEETVLVTLMLANNETGVILEVEKLSKVLEDVNLKREKRRMKPVLLHLDAAQALGKIPVSVKNKTVDYLTIVGHKFYGPRTGALYVKEGRPVCPLVCGGGQEKGLRPGTENTVCIAGLGEAARLVDENIGKYYEHYAKMKSYLKAALVKAFPRGACLVNFTENPNSRQLPNTLSVSFPGHLGSQILANCPNLEASTGAACHSSANCGSASKMLMTLLPERQAIGTLRLSLGRDTTEDDINLAVSYLRETINNL